MIKRFSAILSALFVLTLIIFAGEYNVDQSKQNMVKFISDAPVEDFEGTTAKIDGYIYWEGDDLTGKSNLHFEVDLRTLDTGIGLRNRHMRENYLHTDKYPYAVYKGKVISAEKQSNNDIKVTTEGKMTIHGITKGMKIHGTVTPSGEGYRLKSNFSVKLPDYNIEVPKLMFMRISEKIDLVCDFYVMKKKSDK